MRGMQQPVLDQRSPGTDVRMRASLVLLAALIAVAYAAGQYYVPRSYYIIDSDGHETAPVPLRRLRRSLRPYPYGVGSGADANANANANADASGGGNANANANANAYARSVPGQGLQGTGGYEVPFALLGASRPKTAGWTRSQSGQVPGRSVSASTNVGVDSSGLGYYDQVASVHN